METWIILAGMNIGAAIYNIISISKTEGIKSIISGIMIVINCSVAAMCIAEAILACKK